MTLRDPINCGQGRGPRRPGSGSPATNESAYCRNDEWFLEFYALQRELTAALGRNVAAVRAWQEGRPGSGGPFGEPPPDTAAWRTARLSARRHCELTSLIARAAAGDEDGERLGAWLLASLPVSSFFEIAACARPSLRLCDPAAADCLDRLVAARERLFRANYGLARIAAASARRDDYGDRLSAASCGLLDAIDRYVPSARAARFSYFASYWIRYHVVRQGQKHGSVVVFPIHQHRILLKTGRSHYHRPQVLSLHAPMVNEDGEEGGGWEQMLRDPEPAPGACADGETVSERIGRWMKTSLPPASRVILAFGYSIGPLPEAAADYVEHLREIARERLRIVAT